MTHPGVGRVGFVVFVRKSPGRTGSTKVQIAERRAGRDVVLEHVGTARSEGELAVLMAEARRRLRPGQEAFDLDGVGLEQEGLPQRPGVITGKRAAVLWQVLTAVRKGTTRQAAKMADIPDLVERDFTSEAPGAKLVGDITYVRTWQGWLYVALVIDCYSRAIVGWAMDDNYKTPLITDAIRMAARNLTLPDGAIFHSDRGSNYTSDEYAHALHELGIRQSVGRTGICYDNALSESTNGALKVELVNREQFPTREIARRKIANYIELFYNRRTRGWGSTPSVIPRSSSWCWPGSWSPRARRTRCACSTSSGWCTGRYARCSGVGARLPHGRVACFEHASTSGDVSGACTT
jgi:transposase InsO family protein